eukprot:scaffold211998_cov28-Tisochrysis_lutea.AAC.3
MEIPRGVHHERHLLGEAATALPIGPARPLLAPFDEEEATCQLGSRERGKVRLVHLRGARLGRLRGAFGLDCRGRGAASSSRLSLEELSVRGWLTRRRRRHQCGRMLVVRDEKRAAVKHPIGNPFEKSAFVF